MTHREMMKLESARRMQLCKNGCGGNRQHGSAYCQGCSDKYHSVYATKSFNHQARIDIMQK